MDGYNSSDDDEFNSSDNSIVDPNDIVLKDGIDGNLTKGPWGPEEDKWLICFVTKKGQGKWRRVARELNRTPESCMLRWFNQLNPNISLCRRAPTFNRFTSLSLCPPGHETDDVLYPGMVINPSGLYPSPSQQYASLGNFYSSDARSDIN
ncbi:unnamed protein product [Rhodiola kirilowii]